LNTAIFITARLKSTRLPRKVLREIDGRPMLSVMIERLRLAHRPHRIVLCTSTVEQDDPLETLAVAEGIDCYRGDPDDVLLRLRDAARAFDVDLVASCTADCPFVDPEQMDRMLEFHVANGLDYCNTDGLPFGAFCYTFTRAAVEKACEIKDMTDTEVWGGYFTQTGLFKCGTFEITDPTISRPDLRLTVDEIDDFRLVERIYAELGSDGRVFSLAEIVALCDEHPDIAGINASVQQKPGLPIRVKENSVRLAG
jgi:spore coat polysaccharide biosynthesis protein SpsF